MNGTAYWSTRIFPPRSHGSGAAPFADLLAKGHEKRIAGLTRAERDLIMAWIDTNGLYYGTWDTTEHGCTLADWDATRNQLIAEMQAAGCGHCHVAGEQTSPRFDSDWINLETPQWSRILRAPLAPGGPAMGLGSCRNRPVDPARPRVRLPWNGYAHAVQPLERFLTQPLASSDTSGDAIASFASSEDSHYRTMLAIIDKAREKALSTPRVDMPGARVVGGECRTDVPKLPPRSQNGARLEQPAAANSLKYSP